MATITIPDFVSDDEFMAMLENDREEYLNEYLQECVDAITEQLNNGFMDSIEIGIEVVDCDDNTHQVTSKIEI